MSPVQPSGHSCPFCTGQGSIGYKHFEPWNPGGSAVIGCTRCGLFRMDDASLAVFKGLPHVDRRHQAAISFGLRKLRPSADGVVQVSPEVVRDLVERCDLPDGATLLDNLIRFLGESGKDFGTPVDIIGPYLPAIVGAVAKEHVGAAVEELVGAGLTKTRADKHTAWLTRAGWERFAALKRGTTEGSVAFLARKFDEPSLEEPMKVLKAAASYTGFTLTELRLRAGSIDDQLRVAIRNAPFVLADLTHDNHGAYWEAGFAEGLGKPVFYACERSKWEQFQTHFDTNHLATIIWERSILNKAWWEFVDLLRNQFPALASPPIPGELERRERGDVPQ